MTHLPEPPLADFDTACSQMHDHDPIKCAPEDIPTVDIPVRHLIALLATIAYQAAFTDDDPELQQTLRGLAAYPLDQVAGTIPLVAEDAWRLAAGADALTTFDLDETADATYRHAAIVAEIDVQNTIATDAPEVDARLDAERSALIDGF